MTHDCTMNEWYRTSSWMMSAQGWGYVWNDQPSNGDPHGYPPNSLYSDNSSRAKNMIRRDATGHYTVWFPHLLSGGVANVTPYGADIVCEVRDIRAFPEDGTDVHIVCTRNGVETDAQFSVEYTSGRTGGAATAYLLADRPDEPRYTPSRQFNGTGAMNEVERMSTGQYQLRLRGLGATAGHVQACTYGGRSTWCSIVNWGPDDADQIVRIHCFGNGGVLVDTAFMVTFVRNTNIVLDDTLVSAYAWANDPKSADYEPNVLYSYSSASGRTSIARLGTGEYAVRFPLPLGNGHVQVTPYGTSGSRCVVRRWTDTEGILVDCFDAKGNPVDTYFDVTFAAARV